jgi:hypothetical protein
MISHIMRLFLLSIITACGTSVYSQEYLDIPRIQGEMIFDGNVNDECWKNADPLPLVEHTPTFGNAPSEKTEVMMCYDNTYLYIGGRMFDSDPSKMLVSSKRRDESEVSTEGLTIIIDSFNDKENALGFLTTPTGLRSDFTIAKDAMGRESGPGEGPFNMSWNTFWDVKTVRNEEGWFAEIRIPFSSMRFKEDNGKVVMGLICMRYIAHKNELVVFPEIPPDWGEFSAFRPSKSREVVFEGLKSRKPFYIAPYIIGGKQWEHVLNESASGYNLEKDPRLNAGLDIKYGLTNNITLDLTLNTDFAQVEADNEQINLTRFSLFFPEKRTFFQERSSVFAFDFEPGGSLFYSRRIGLFEGEPVPIYGGARITGMAGKWDVGFLDMQTKEIDILPSENFGLLRLRRQVINESSYVGGIFTSRLGVNGSRNTAYGLDGIFKVLENDYLNVKAAQVFDNSLSDRSMSFDKTRLYINWNRFTQKGLNYELTWTRSGKDFNPGIGFLTRSDYTHYFGGLGYGWVPGESSFLQRHQLGLNVIAFTDNSDNSTQTLESSLMYDFTFKSGYNGVFLIKHAYENVRDTFYIARNSFVPSGEFRYNEFETHLNSTQKNKFIWGVDFYAGTFYDGNRFSFGLEPALNVGSSLQLAITYDHNFIHFKNRNSFSGGVAGFKALVMLTTKFSVSSFIQYNSAEHAAITNFRVRYNPHEGNDFYIVFNEGRNTYRDIENPRLPLYNVRSLLLKYTYTFTI